MTEILRLINGSKLYGLDTAESDDDYVGIFVESPNVVFAGSKCQTKKLHDRPDGAHAQPGDVDGIAYSVRHFFNLALGGNPTLLALLFAPRKFVVLETDWGLSILENSDLFLSKKAGPRFLGYMRSQLERLQGIKTGHIPNRPWLVEQYGYDVKYASQVARLGFQGIEYFTYGTISSPMPVAQRATCREIRAGKFTYDQVIERLELIRTDLDKAIEESQLPEEPQYDKVWALSRKIHEEVWASRHN